MNRIFYALLAALSFTTNVLPLTVNSTLLENKNTGKRVLLFGEMHTQYAKQILSDTEKTACNAIEENQKKDFTKLGHTLLTLNPKEGAQTVVISEISPNTLSCHFEEELGLVETQDHHDETLHVMPRLFLKNILAPAATVDEKTALFQSSVKPFNDTPAASFVFNNQMRWIVGNTLRKEKDQLLALEFYEHWKSILESLKNKEEMPAELAELSIAHVKEYIGLWHDEFVKNGIDDSYAQKILISTDNALKASKVAESDHFAALHEYLHNNDQKSERDTLNNNIIKFLSLKNDLEVQTYVQQFEKDSGLKYLIMNFGSAHTENARKLLGQRGYQVVEKTGCDVSEPTTAEDVKSQMMQALTFLKKHPDMVQVNALFKH